MVDGREWTSVVLMCAWQASKVKVSKTLSIKVSFGIGTYLVTFMPIFKTVT